MRSPSFLGALLTLACCVGCNSDDDGAGQLSPFLWDAGADGSNACAAWDCLNWLFDDCHIHTIDECAGSNTDIREDGIYILSCYSDGSRRLTHLYDSTTDTQYYRPDGSLCMLERSAGNHAEWRDPKNRLLATSNADSTGLKVNITCGGHSANERGACKFDYFRTGVCRGANSNSCR